MASEKPTTKICKYCKTEIPYDAKVCPQCRKKQGSNGCLTVILVIVAFFVLIMIIGGSGEKSSSKAAEKTEETAVSSSTESSSVEETTAENKESSASAPTDAAVTTNMAVGDTVNSGELTIGLSYVKTASSITYATGSNEPASDGNEIVFVFFDVCNSGNKTASFSKSDVSAYADSSNVVEVQDYFLFKENGIKEMGSYELDSGTCAFVPMDFEVPKGWQELTIFYHEYSWTVKSEDVTSEPFAGTSIYTIQNDHEATPIGYTASADKYEVQYDGFETIPQEYNWSGPWVAYKFTITNTDSEALDLGLWGYNMRSYQNGYLMDDSSYTVDDNLNGYINVYSVDEIKPGMTAKIYIAFETDNVNGNFMLAFDDGYIFNHVVDYFYAVN